MSSAQIVKHHEYKNRCNICKIRTYSFCRCLSEDKLKSFSNISFEKKYYDKQNIFIQKDPSTHLFNITEGNVKIYQLLDDGRIQIIGFLYPGDFLDLIEIINIIIQQKRLEILKRVFLIKKYWINI